MFLNDPNLIYLALIFSLWLGVTALYLPGTGVLEVIAAGTMIGVIVLLSQIPTNWGAVILLVVGVLSFIVMPFLKRQFVPLAVGGLVLQAVGGWFMLPGTPVSAVIIGLTVALSLAYYRYALIPILERTRQQPLLDEDSALIGAHGRVIRALDPIGTVNVRGELWTATSDYPLESGEDVIVVEREGLNILVEGVKRKRARLNGHEE
jgi:membrane-bound ClpP family serine protease